MNACRAYASRSTWCQVAIRRQAFGFATWKRRNEACPCGSRIPTLQAGRAAAVGRRGQVLDGWTAFGIGHVGVHTPCTDREVRSGCDPAGSSAAHMLSSPSAAFFIQRPGHFSPSASRRRPCGREVSSAPIRFPGREGKWLRDSCPLPPDDGDETLRRLVAELKRQG